jgi:ribosome-binding protein aMBF1 (putative translation factor)
MTSLKELKKDWLSDPDNQVAYDELGPEFDLARKLIAARAAAGLSQAQVAERMGTKQSEVSRIEGARQNVSYAKLRSYAKAVGAKLNISLEPAG